MMKDFDQLIQEDIDSYEGRQDEVIYQAPALFRLLTNLLQDPNLPGRLRPLVIATVGYFALPADIMSEDLQGPSGYLDDIFLSAFVADQIRQALGTDKILTENWDGQAPVLALIDDILSRESDLIEDRRELIFWYIGYEYLPGW
jgi:uncharacterized membrane protein YkvA (DUF1232 family)